MAAQVPGIHSPELAGDFPPPSTTTHLLPKPPPIPISFDDHQPPQFPHFKEDPIQAPPSSSSAQIIHAPPSEEEAVEIVTINEEEEDHDDGDGVAGVCFDSFSSKMPSYSSSSSALNPKPMEGLHESGPPPFLRKIFEMVDDPETNSTVSWSKNGDSFTVWDACDFSKHLLPKYFKHSNFCSFIRQLNTYGFRKIDPDKWEFANEGFRGGKKHLLKNIRRRCRQNKHQQRTTSGNYCNAVDSEKIVLESQIESLKNDQDKLRVEIHKLRHQQEESEIRISTVEQRIQAAHNKQLQMLLFLAKAAKKRSFIRNLMGKIRQRRELINGFCKKRRLLQTQSPEFSPDEENSGSHSQSVDCRNEAQQQLATMHTQITEILGEDTVTVQVKTIPKLFETPLVNDEDSVYRLMSENLLEDCVVPNVEDDLDLNDSKFYLELEDLIGKPRTNWSGFATGVTGPSCI